MAILNFPDHPVQGDQYTGDNGTTYIFDGIKWVGRAVAQPAGTNSITNNGHTLQIDGDGNIVIPTGAHIYYQNGTALPDAQGPAGPQGIPGTAATIVVGTVTTGIAGSGVEILNSGTTTAATFNFTIPRGDKGDRGPAGTNGLNGTNGINGVGQKGDRGDKGDTGAQGVSVTLQGTKATIADLPLTGNPGDGWIVTTGDGGTHLDGSLWFWNIADQVWNDIGKIVGPKGDTGNTGDRGLKGDTGTNGQNGQNGLDGAGVATGGVANQVLAKIDDVDFNTHWVTNDRLTNTGGDQLILDSTGTLTFPSNSGGIEYPVNGEWDLHRADGKVYIGSVDNMAYIDTYDANIGVRLRANENDWIFDANGLLTVPGSIHAQEGNDLNIVVYNPTVDNVLGGVTFSVQNRDVASGNKTTQFDLGPADIKLTTDFGGNRNEWTFGADGNLTIPTGGSIYGLFTIGDEGANVQVDHATEKVYIRTYPGGNGSKEWEFGTDGKLTFPNTSTFNGNDFVAKENEDLNLTILDSSAYIGVKENNNNLNDPAAYMDVYYGKKSRIRTASLDNQTEHDWIFNPDGNLTLPEGGVIKNSDGSQYGGSGAGGVFDMSYTYQSGSFLQGYNDPATPDGVFSSNSELLNDTSDLVEDTDYIYISTFDANAKDVHSMFNWVADAGVGAQIRVTDPQGNQVARLVSDQIGWTSSNWNLYNGYEITVTRMWGNGTPSKAKIMITQTQSQQFNGDYTTNSDWAQWSYGGTDHPMLFVLYGENSQMPIDITQLWNFATSAVDTFSSLATALDRRTAFYSQIDALITNSFPPGTLFEDFQFYNTNGTYFDGGTQGVTVNSPGGGNGAYFTVTWDFERYWVKRDGQRQFGGGTGYAPGDTFVVQGDYFAANTRGVNGVNDLTITVTEIDGVGAIKRFTVAGVPPEPWWPADHIYDGGADQEDNANYIFTDITGNNANQGHDRAAAQGETLQAVPYNGGVVNSTEGFFTATGAPTGEYVVTYRNSVFALFVTGNTSTLLETDGNSGFDGNSQLSFSGNPNVLGYAINVKVVEGGGSWVPGTKYNFTFDFNNALGNTKFFGDYIVASSNHQINIVSWGGEGSLHIPPDRNLAYNTVVLRNGGYLDTNNVYDNSGVEISIGSGRWIFRQDVNNVNNLSGTGNQYIDNPNNTRTVSPQNKQCYPNADTVVYSSTNSYISAIKLFLMAEGTPDGAPYDNSNQWDTQATDAIVVHTPYNSATVNTPAITVYGRVYTGTIPVATFSVRRNAITGRIEVLARPTSTMYSCYVRATATEIMTQD